MSKARQKRSENVELRRLMEGMREEVAREFGLPGAGSSEFADLSSKVCGTYGQKLWSRAKEILAHTQDAHPSDERILVNKNKKRNRNRPN